MSAADASDGGSSTETEDEASYEQSIKPEPTADTLALPEATTEVQVLTETLAVKSEPEDVESSVTEDGNLELKPEPATTAPVLTQNSAIKSEPEAVKSVVKSEPKTESSATQEERLEVKPGAPIAAPTEAISQSEPSLNPPCCSACGYPLLDVPQEKLLKLKTTLDCKCCLLVLPTWSFSNTQRSEARKDIRKCKACTGNMVRGAAPTVKPTREKPQIPEKLRASSKEKRTKEASAVFVNKVGRLKMAKDALQRKRNEASKLKATKRREEYEQQLAKEEKDLERQSALLKRENPGAFKSLMSELKIKKPPTYEQDRKAKAKKKANTAKRKREAAGDAGPAKKKKKVPAVDPTDYAPPGSAADAVPARVIPTRSRVRSTPQAAELKAEVKGELPKVE